MNTFGKSLLALGAIGLSSLAVAPAFAGSVGGAYASGSSAIVLMNGASQSVGGEISLPSGAYFNGNGAGTGALLVTPTLAVPAAGAGTGLATNAQNLASLVVDPGLPNTTTPLTGGSFTAAAASALNAATTAGSLDAQVSIIRAGTGVNGLD